VLVIKTTKYPRLILAVWTPKYSCLTGLRKRLNDVFHWLYRHLLVSGEYWFNRRLRKMHYIGHKHLYITWNLQRPTNNDVMCCVYRLLHTNSLYWIYRLLNIAASQGYIDAFVAPLCTGCGKPTFASCSRYIHYTRHIHS